MKQPTTSTRHSTDFDVISGPSMASACPIVESDSAPSVLPDTIAATAPASTVPGSTPSGSTADRADAA